MLGSEPPEVPSAYGSPGANFVRKRPEYARACAVATQAGSINAPARSCSLGRPGPLPLGEQFLDLGQVNRFQEVRVEPSLAPQRDVLLGAVPGDRNQLGRRRV